MADNIDERVSIWSVQGKHRYLFSVCVVVLFITGLGSVWYYEKELFTTLFDTIKTVLTLGAFSVTSVFIAYEGVTVVTVATEFFLREREKKGRQKGREEILNWLSKEHPDISIPPSFLDEANGKEPDNRT